MSKAKGFMSIAGAILLLAVIGSFFAAYAGMPVKGRINSSIKPSVINNH